MEITSAYETHEITLSVRLAPDERFTFRDGKRRIFVYSLAFTFRGITREDTVMSAPSIDIGEAYQVRADGSLGRRISVLTFLPSDASPEIGRAMERCRSRMVTA